MQELKTEIYEDEVLPETKLWRAVIQRAFEDVIYPGMERSLIMFKYQAHLWFINNSENFKIICNLADLNDKTVREKYLKMVDNEQIYFTKEQINYINWRKKYNERRNIDNGTGNFL
jgi:hypothetical protein